MIGWTICRVSIISLTSYQSIFVCKTHPTINNTWYLVYRAKHYVTKGRKSFVGTCCTVGGV